MNLPTFTAEASFYRTTGYYQTVGFVPSFTVMPNPPIYNKTCDEWMLATERAVAYSDWQICLNQCATPYEWCRRYCSTAYAKQIKFLTDLYGCPTGTVCTSDIRFGSLNYCCPPGTTACGGQCIPCASPKKVNPSGCQCECPSISCAAPKMINPNTCNCECPFPCSGAKQQDPITCQCFCPTGLTDCNGIC